MAPLPHERYVAKPFLGSSHSWALECCAALPTGTRLLDVGCGSGVMGRELKALGWSSLSAVEIDPAARRYVSPWYQRVEPELQAFKPERFDLILLLDVIEHLPDPLAYLKEVQGLLAAGGSILISVPNVAHWSVRGQLLFGFFQYTQRGILDQTHLRFFTRRSFLALLKSLENCRVTGVTSSIAPLELVLPPWLWHNHVFRYGSRARLCLARWLPGLLAYQHLAQLQRCN